MVEKARTRPLAAGSELNGGLGVASIFGSARLEH